MRPSCKSKQTAGVCAIIVTERIVTIGSTPQPLIKGQNSGNSVLPTAVSHRLSNSAACSGTEPSANPVVDRLTTVPPEAFSHRPTCDCTTPRRVFFFVDKIKISI